MFDYALTAAAGRNYVDAGEQPTFGVRNEPFKLHAFAAAASMRPFPDDLALPLARDDVVVIGVHLILLQ